MDDFEDADLSEDKVEAPTTATIAVGTTIKDVIIVKALDDGDSIIHWIGKIHKKMCQIEILPGLLANVS